MNQHIMEIEHHAHSDEVWMEPDASPSGETDIAVVAGTTPTAPTTFQIDAGNNAWGAWTQILGSNDTPVYVTGAKYFDLHKLGITATERNELYYIQIGAGTVSGGALTGSYTTIFYHPTAASIKNAAILFQARRHAVNTKMWARCVCPGQDTGTINFTYGMHLYLA